MTASDLTVKRARGWTDAGWLVLRLGIGATFIFAHGGPKLLGGPEKWAGIGAAVGLLGIEFGHTAWGFLAGLSEALGGLLLILGFLVRPAAFFMLLVMLTAIRFHVSRGESFVYPLEMGIVLLALLVGGGGRYALGRRFCCCQKKQEPTVPAQPKPEPVRSEETAHEAS